MTLAHFRYTLALPVALLGLATVAAAQQTNLTAFIDGTQEVPPVATPAFGHAGLVLDQTNHFLYYNITISGLSSPETLAHIHCCAPPGMNAGIMFGLPLGSPKIGFVAVTPAQEANLLSG